LLLKKRCGMEEDMKRMIVSAVAAAFFAFASGTATAEATSKTAFPRQEDPWQQWGKPHPKPPVVYAPPQTYYVHHYYVWVPAQWWWDGAQWVLVPGYWRVW
jgi:hypothetical protein